MHIYISQKADSSLKYRAIWLGLGAGPREREPIPWPLNALCASLKRRRGGKEKEKNDFPVHRPLAGSCTKFNLYFL